ncbi:Retrovirus-related Pol polyprotein from transposon 17.6 [Vitis vinifera]|uniref:Retrovirus-related Pol polyprotein from transposon 17.6 n=1 Tax=Vitis vinifera TaxID=29760 RepID=A0A438H280_VITVI|nr:Retrovirus-related Pol polyprotein from transposon 17.6 [Vitis vinifera]
MQVSFEVQRSGCPTISVMIGGKVVEKALLDLGASVNLLPYSVYKQLGLGELKPTSITLSLADRSVKIPRGPFLATSNAIINCRNGLMQLTFGNMTLELNIFYMSKKQITPEEEEGPEEVCIIDTLVEEHCWRRREEILPLFNKEEAQKLIKKRPKAQFEASAHGVEIHIPGKNNNALLLYLHLLLVQEKCLLEVLRGRWCELSAEATSSRYYLPISDSPWVSPTQVVPKKSGITVVQNEKGEEIHYTPHFRSGEDYFTCPFGTYAYRRMPFGLCNAPATFQRCMLSIFSDMVERIMEVFMDDITIYGGTFEECLVNLEAVLKDALKGLGAQLGEMPFYGTSRNCPWPYHLEKGIEVDKAKVDLLSNCPPTTVKGVRQFLGHAGFYRRFIKDFSNLSKPLCELLAKDAKAPNWQLPFEVMCDASDFAIGAVLGQREDGKPYVIYYASKTLNEAQRNYTTTEKELLAVFALDKFRAYLMDSYYKSSISKSDKKGVENVVADHLSSEWKAQDRKHFFAKIHAYYWEDLSFKYCADQIIRKCVPEEEQQGILAIAMKCMWRPLCLSENSHEGVAIRVYLAITFQRCPHHV